MSIWPVPRKCETAASSAEAGTHDWCAPTATEATHALNAHRRELLRPSTSQRASGEHSPQRVDRGGVPYATIPRWLTAHLLARQCPPPLRPLLPWYPAVRPARWTRQPTPWERSAGLAKPADKRPPCQASSTNPAARRHDRDSAEAFAHQHDGKRSSPSPSPSSSPPSRSCSGLVTLRVSCPDVHRGAIRSTRRGGDVRRRWPARGCVVRAGIAHAGDDDEDSYACVAARGEANLSGPVACLFPSLCHDWPGGRRSSLDCHLG